MSEVKTKNTRYILYLVTHLMLIGILCIFMFLTVGKSPEECYNEISTISGILSFRNFRTFLEIYWIVTGLLIVWFRSELRLFAFILLESGCLFFVFVYFKIYLCGE